MTSASAKIDPVTAIINAKGFRLRLAALILSTVALALPGASGSAFGMSHSTSILELAGWFALVPILIAAAIIMPGVAAQYSRLVDIIAAMVAMLAVAHAFYLVFSAMNQVSQITGAARGMGGNNPFASQMSQVLGVGVNPGWGLAVWIAATALLITQAVRSYKTAKMSDT